MRSKKNLIELSLSSAVKAGRWLASLPKKNKFLLIPLLLLCAPELYATTPVIGNIKNLGGGTITTGAYVRFWLRGCTGNQPRVNGIAIIGPTAGGVFYFDMVASNTGSISGTLYSTRDSTGLLGGDIDCGGSHVSVWYGMQVFQNGRGGPEVAIHAMNGVTLDISTVAPLIATPNPAAPISSQGPPGPPGPGGNPFLGPDPYYDVTNKAYGTCSFDGVGDDTSCWNAAITAEEAGGVGDIYLPCGKVSKVTSSLNLSVNDNEGRYETIRLCGVLRPTGTLTLAHGNKRIIGVPGALSVVMGVNNPASNHIPYTLIDTSAFVGTGPVIALAQAVDSIGTDIENIGILNCAGDCIQLNTTSVNSGVFATLRNDVFSLATSSTGWCFESWMGFGLDVEHAYCSGATSATLSGVLLSTGMSYIHDMFMQNASFLMKGGTCSVGVIATMYFDNIKTENFTANNPALFNFDTTGPCPVKDIDIGPNIYMADEAGGGQYLLAHVGADTSSVEVNFHSVGSFTGGSVGLVNGSNISYTSNDEKGINLNGAFSIHAFGAQNYFGSCQSPFPFAGITFTDCSQSSPGAPDVVDFAAAQPSSVDGPIIRIFSKGNSTTPIGGWCTSQTFGGFCGSSASGHAYGPFWEDVNTGGFGVFRSEGITASAQRNWKFPDYDLSVAGFDVAQTWTAKQTCGANCVWSNLVADSLSGFIYVDGITYAKNGTGIAAAINALPSCTISTFGQTWTHCGTVMLGPGTYTISSEIAVSSPMVHIKGAGAEATYLNYTGTTGCTFNWTSTPFNTGGEEAEELSDLTIDGSGASAGTCGVHYHDIIAFTMNRVDIRFFKGSGSVGLWTDVQSQFNEREKIQAQLYDNTVGWHITNNVSTASAAVTVGYADYDFAINPQTTGSTGILMENGGSAGVGSFPYLTYSNMHIIINGPASGTETGISIQNGEWETNNYNIHMEGITTRFNLAANIAVNGTGNIQANNGITDTLGSGATIMTNSTRLDTINGVNNLVIGDITQCDTSNPTYSVTACGRLGTKPFRVDYNKTPVLQVDTDGTLTSAANLVTGNYVKFPELGSAPGGASGDTLQYALSTNHWPAFNPNNAGNRALCGLTGTVTSGHIVAFNQSGTVCDLVDGGTGTGSGTVTSFSANTITTASQNFATASVATPGTTPALTYTLSNVAAGHKFFGNNSGVAAAPDYESIGEADLPAATVFTDQNATFGAHTYDFSGVTLFKLRVGAGATTSANGDFAFDSTNNNWHGWNGADRIFAPLASGFVSGHCGQPTSSAGKWEIVDTGAACGSGTGPTLQTGTVNNSSQSLLNFDQAYTTAVTGAGVSFKNTSGGIEEAQITTTVGGGNAVPIMTQTAARAGDFLSYSSPTAIVNTTPGVAVNAQTGATYTVVTGDRGKLLTFSNASAIAVTLPQANSTGFDTNFYFCVKNIGLGPVTITPTTSTINAWGGTAAASLPIFQGMGACIKSDNTNYLADMTGPPNVGAVDQVNVTTANSGSAQNIVAVVPSTGRYNVFEYIDENAGSSCSVLGPATLTSSFAWSDGTSRNSINNSQLTLTPHGSSGTDDWAINRINVWAVSGSAITVTTTFTQCTTGTWSYDAHYYVEKN